MTSLLGCANPKVVLNGLRAKFNARYQYLSKLQTVNLMQYEQI